MELERFYQNDTLSLSGEHFRGTFNIGSTEFEAEINWSRSWDSGDSDVGIESGYDYQLESIENITNLETGDEVELTPREEHFLINNLEFIL